MAENQEKIEGRLCEFIEGTLDSAGRAEIEKHLAGNPQHKRLLDELSRSRGMMHQLPRADAPPEINEHLQGQLERAVLLGDLADDLPRHAMRINPWPRIGAIAAILLLAAGLGAVIYFVLPNPKSAEQLALKPAGAAGSAPTTLPAGEEAEERAVGGATAVALGPPHAAPSPAAVATPAPASPVAGTGVAEARVGGVAAAGGPAAAPGGQIDPNRARRALASDAVASAPPTGASAAAIAPAPAAADSLAAAAPAPEVTSNATAPVELRPLTVPTETAKLFADAGLSQEELRRNRLGANTVPIVLRTDNPTLANVQIERYLTENKIAYEAVGQSLFGDAASNVGSAGSSAPLTPNAYAVNRTSDTATGRIEQAALGKQAAGPATAPSQRSAESQQNSPATTQPTEAVQSRDASAGVVAEPPKDEQARPGDGGRGEQLIIARNLTRQQVVDLSQTLQQNAAATAGAAGGSGAANPPSLPQEPAQFRRYDVRLKGLPPVAAATTRPSDETATEPATTMPASVAPQLAQAPSTAPTTAPTTQPLAIAAKTPDRAGEPAVAPAGSLDSPIRPGEMIDVRIGQQGGPARVADDGKILLPGGEIVTAAGLTPAQLQNDLHQRLAGMKVPVEVSVSRAGQFQRQQQQNEQAPQQVAELPASTQPAATQPAQQLAEGGGGDKLNDEQTDQRMNVVIVVQGDSSSIPAEPMPSQVQFEPASVAGQAPSTAPSTQPTAPPVPGR